MMIPLYITSEEETAREIKRIFYPLLNVNFNQLKS